MKITFVLPIAGTHPIGGFKVVYEYANYMAARGHEVSVVHPAVFRKDRPLRKMGLKGAVKTVLEYVTLRKNGGWKPTSWFAMRTEVKMLWVPSLKAKHVPDGDVVVATAWETAEWVTEYPVRKGKKFYLVQGYETWAAPEERVIATWKLPLRKIVIAEWLAEIGEGLGETSYRIDNGLDFERFQLTTPIEGRDPYKVLMVYHHLELKGTADGLAAFEIARKQEPRLKLTLFGVSPKPEVLPEGTEFHYLPAQETLLRLYNETSIFLATSWQEGFSLPSCEALQCGATLVTTDFGGNRAYAIHDKTALLSAIKNPEALADNIVRAVRDESLRLRLARAGHDHIQSFTWERAGTAMKKLFEASLR